jgi:hypothetical protein
MQIPPELIELIGKNLQTQDLLSFRLTNKKIMISLANLVKSRRNRFYSTMAKFSRLNVAVLNDINKKCIRNIIYGSESDYNDTFANNIINAFRSLYVANGEVVYKNDMCIYILICAQIQKLFIQFIKDYKITLTMQHIQLMARSNNLLLFVKVFNLAILEKYINSIESLLIDVVAEGSEQMFSHICALKPELTFNNYSFNLNSVLAAKYNLHTDFIISNYDESRLSRKSFIPWSMEYANKLYEKGLILKNTYIHCIIYNDSVLHINELIGFRHDALFRMINIMKPYKLFKELIYSDFIIFGYIGELKYITDITLYNFIIDDYILNHKDDSMKTEKLRKLAINLVELRYDRVIDDFTYVPVLMRLIPLVRVTCRYHIRTYDFAIFKELKSLGYIQTIQDYHDSESCRKTNVTLAKDFNIIPTDNDFMQAVIQDKILHYKYFKSVTQNDFNYINTAIDHDSSNILSYILKYEKPDFNINDIVLRIFEKRAKHCIAIKEISNIPNILELCKLAVMSNYDQEFIRNLVRQLKHVSDDEMISIINFAIDNASDLIIRIFIINERTKKDSEIFKKVAACLFTNIKKVESRTVTHLMTNIKGLPLMKTDILDIAISLNVPHNIIKKYN